jgi:hypothetical protein
LAALVEISIHTRQAQIAALVSIDQAPRQREMLNLKHGSFLSLLELTWPWVRLSGLAIRVDLALGQ